MNNCSVQGCQHQPRRRGLCGSHYWRWRKYGDPLAGNTPLGALPRWIQDVALQAPKDKCVLWPFATYHDGYGKIGWKGRSERVHRVICRLAHGSPPNEGMDAAHNCGIRLCGNPHHVRWATRADNLADCKVHGTVNYGSRNGSVKLTEADVVAIRVAHGIHEAIADQFGVSRRLVGMIKSRTIWAWLP